MQAKNTPRRGAREHRPRPQAIKTIRRQAARYIAQAGLPARLRDGLQSALARPSELRARVAALDEAYRRANEIGRLAHELGKLAYISALRHGGHDAGFAAYVAALKFYHDHYDQPAVVARYAAQLEA